MIKALDATARAPSVKPGLLRILGISFGLAVIVGSTLGIGILRTPGLVAAQLPNRSAILAVWVVGGLYTLLGSVCLTELGTMLPQAGGYYVYARHAFGDTVGFAVGWTDWLTYCAVLGYVSIGMSEFVALLVPSLRGGVFRRLARSRASVRQRSGAPFLDDAGWRDRGAAVRHHHLWRLAEPAVLHGGRPRSRPQPSAIDDRRRDRGHRHLPAGEPRAAGGAAGADPRSFDAAG